MKATDRNGHTIETGARVQMHFTSMYGHPAAAHAATVETVVSLPGVGDFVNVTLDEAHAHFGARIFNVNPNELTIA